MSGVVVIGFAEAMAAPEATWSLVDAGFQVLAFSRRSRRSALRHSRFATVCEITAPEEDWSASLREIEHLLNRCGGDASVLNVLLPLDDTSLWLAERVSRPSNWVLAGPRATAARFALDKIVQVQAANAAGFQVPATAVASTLAELRSHATRLPVILRPAQAVCVDGMRLRKGQNWICSDRRELECAGAAWRENGPLLVQPFILGNGEGVFGLATERGVTAWSAHRRLRMMNPHGSGSSACASRPVPDEIKLPVGRLIRDSEWRGLFMVEFLRDHSNSCWFVEFNGRAWGSMALARRQGLEYPAWAVQLALDAGFSPPLVPAKEIECRNLGRELMHLAFVFRGPKSSAIHPWPSFWRSALDFLHISSGSACYNWRRDDWKVFLADACYTAREQIFKSKA